jgi:hypothetical protein
MGTGPAVRLSHKQSAIGCIYNVWKYSERSHAPCRSLFHIRPEIDLSSHIWRAVFLSLVLFQIPTKL